MVESEHSRIINRRMRLAISSRNLAEVQELITSYGLSYSPRWLDGYELLRFAAERDCIEIIKYLLSIECPINCYSTNKKTPLDFAIIRRSNEMFFKLIEMDADAREQRNDESLLHIAIDICHGQWTKLVIELLLGKGVDVNSKNNKGKTPLHLAAEKSNLEVMELLIDKKAFLDSQCSDGKTALYFAIEKDHYDSSKLEALRLLISKGANVNLKCVSGKSPLHAAAERCQLKTVDFLIANNATIDSQCSEGKTALHFAIEKEDYYPNKTEVVRMLLANSANANIKCFKGKSPLRTAIEKTVSSETIEMLIAKNASIDSQCPEDKPPLFIAFDHGNWRAFKILIEKGASVDIRDENNVSLLHLISRSQRVDIDCITTLLDKSSTIINAQDNEGKTPLHVAIEKKNWTFARMLIVKKAFVDISSENGETSLHASVKERNFEELEFIVKQGVCTGEGLKSKCKLGWTPLDLAVKLSRNDMVYLILDHLLNDSQKLLLLAVKNGDIDMLEKVLKDGVNKEDEINRLVFHTALRSDNAKIVEKLTEFGFEVDPRDVNYRIILNKSITYGYLKVVEDFFKYGIDLKNLDLSEYANDAATALHLAAMHGQDEIAKLLINSGAEINAKDYMGNPPIFYAAIMKNFKIVELLFSHGANITGIPDVLTCAVEKGSVELVKTILLKDVDVNAVSNRSGMNALHSTALGKEDIIQTEIAKLLLSAGADVNANQKFTTCPETKGEGFFELMEICMAKYYDNTVSYARKPGIRGRSTLHAAIEVGYPLLVETLLEHKADVNAMSADDDETPLHISARGGNPLITDMLVKKGADTQTVAVGNVSALHLAVAYDRLQVVKILCEAGADVNAKTYFDFTSLHAAAKTASYEIARILLEFGAGIESKDGNGRTPLNLASAQGNEKVVHILLRKGANIESKGKSGDTCLHLASAAGHTEIVRILLKEGANVDCKNISGVSPLHMGAENGHEDIVGLLLENNADIDCKCYKKETPLHLAVAKGRDNVVNLLIKKGSDLNVRCEEGTAICHTVAQVKQFKDWEDDDDDDYDCYSHWQDDYDPYYGINRHASYGRYRPRVFEYKPVVVQEECFNIIQRYVHTMAAVNLFLHHEFETFYCLFAKSTHLKCQKDLQEELLLMKISPIGNSTVTFFNFLKKDINRLAMILKNEEIFKIFQSKTYKFHFPNFSSLLSNHFHKGLYRLALIKKVIANSSEIFPKLPEEVVEVILIYLNREDLINIFSVMVVNKQPF